MGELTCIYNNTLKIIGKYDTMLTSFSLDNRYICVHYIICNFYYLKFFLIKKLTYKKPTQTKQIWSEAMVGGENV